MGFAYPQATHHQLCPINDGGSLIMSEDQSAPLITEVFSSILTSHVSL